MALKSSYAGAGAKADEAYYNTLREDLAEHTHEGTDTDAQDHTNLSSVGNNTHDQIDAHIDAELEVHIGTATPSGEYVLLSQDGSAPYTGQMRLETGRARIDIEFDKSFSWETVAVSFENAFGAKPLVNLQKVTIYILDSHGEIEEWPIWKSQGQVTYAATSVTASGFTLEVYHENSSGGRVEHEYPPVVEYDTKHIYIDWVAMGAIA